MLTVLSLISALPLISAAPIFLLMANNKELKENFEVFNKIIAKEHKKEVNIYFKFQKRPGRLLGIIR